MRKTLACLAALVAAAAANAAPIGFSGPYAPGNWTISNTGPAGNVNTAGAPGSVTLTSANSGGGFSNQFFTITAPTSGPISFKWNYVSNDVNGSLFDPFGYVLNGVFTQLTTNVFKGGTHQSGTVTVFVNKGDVFGFDQQSTDSILGSGVTTISAFDAPVPEPISIVVFGGLVAGGGLLARRRMAKAAVAA